MKFSGNQGVQDALADGIKTFVISWKETDPSAIRSFLADIPNGLTVYTSFNHEPENDQEARARRLTSTGQRSTGVSGASRRR